MLSLKDRRAASLLAAVALVTASSCTFADTTVKGSGLTLKSSGAASGTGWTLSSDGYLGTYVRLDKSGTLKFTLNAKGTSSHGVAPDLTFSIADYKKSFAVASGATNYTYTSPGLPAGTYFVRAQLDNSKTVLVNNKPVSLTPKLTLNSLAVGANAAVLNSSSDANALAAANTYIANFRQGAAKVKLTGVTPGQTVHVKLTNNAFKLGTYVPGSSIYDVNGYLGSNPSYGSLAANYQEFINGRFNAVVNSNAGKWGINEPTQNGFVDMAGSDATMNYAASHGMAARMHNLIWGEQQPAWVNTLISKAGNGDSGAKASLVNAIVDRITYTVKYNNYLNGAVRGNTFTQMDVLNEAFHNSVYLKALGTSGVADVYKKTAAALAGVGSNAKLYLNEYNVLQYSPAAIYSGKSSGADAYANWYRQGVVDVNNAGFAAGATKNVVGGIGMEYYPTTVGRRPTVGVMQQALQNLSVEGLPLTLSEFGVKSEVQDGTAPQIMDDAIRMIMGTPNADTFMYWGWWAGATDYLGGGSTLVNYDWKNGDGTWNLTAVGKRFEYLYGRGLDPTAPDARADGSNPHPWTTDLTRVVAADGTIDFTGFYGDYAIDAGAQTGAFTLSKATTAYQVQLRGFSSMFASVDVPEPAGLGVAGLTAAIACTRRRRG